MAHSFARIIIVREGEADWIGEHHSQHVTLGDVLVIGANTRCGATLDYAMTATTMYLNDVSSRIRSSGSLPHLSPTGVMFDTIWRRIMSPRRYYESALTPQETLRHYSMSLSPSVRMAARADQASGPASDHIQKRRSPGESCLSPGLFIGMTGFEPATP
ncbi:hypothetical protein ELQ92_16045 [Labedella populi]|uniref:Uncharacterized protein n=2 Tax=Labedella populi TaxID=2498850 RepID=A0A3S3ZGA7_9MICO|nr:hypothetical protein ELQ92_16045 [Labedella populi]